MSKHSRFGRSHSVKIECSLEQAQLIAQALEFYERVLGLGQLEEILSQQTFLGRPGAEQEGKRAHVKRALYLLKYLHFGLSEYESRGIYSSEIPIRVLRMYDMMKTIRHKLARYQYEQGELAAASAEEENADLGHRHLRYTVDFDPHYPMSEDTPIVVTVVGAADEAEASGSANSSVPGTGEAVSVPSETVRGDAD